MEKVLCANGRIKILPKKYNSNSGLGVLSVRYCFFEIVKRQTKSVSKSSNWNFDARVTKGEREVSKIRSDVFFRLKRGEFISFADGKDKRVKFKKPDIQRALPKPRYAYNDAEIHANYQRIHLQVRQLFKDL